MPTGIVILIHLHPELHRDVPILLGAFGMIAVISPTSKPINFTGSPTRKPAPLLTQVS